MGKKNKLQRFEDNKNFSNLFQWPALPSTPDMDMKGIWAQTYFGNLSPIVLEVGCGKGDYTIGLAKMFPEKNYIGIDIKGARLWRGCKTALEQKISQVVFVRTQVEFMNKIFAPNEIDEIWVTFPDPQPQKPRKRLTSPDFLARYAGVMKEGGCVHLKTDDDALYEYTLHEVVEAFNLECICATAHLYQENESVFLRAKALQTFYESRWLKEGKTIKYISFRIGKDFSKAYINQ